MCGIAGFVDPTANDPKAILAEMTNCIKHRGPDADGHWFDADVGIALGHRRLSIVDLSPTGAQPMISSDDRFVISFNGEIYNFRELRHELEGIGRRFRGTSDTEVMLEAFSTWGVEAAVAKFNGMFALALWDREERDFYLIRDRLGVKPLYYLASDNTIIFGSELKSIKAHPGFKAELSHTALQAYMTFGYIPAPLSIYKGIKKLPPATIAKWSALNGSFDPLLSTYWSPISFVHKNLGATRPVADLVNDLHDLLRDAIRLRMVADVPVGAFLSGGIDSSLVVAIMQELNSSPIKTFSIGFDEKDYNEAHYAKDVASYLGTDHTELYVTPKEARDVIPLLPQFYDEPFGDSSMIPTYLVSKLTREHVTVSLSGDGGDELFLGYNRYYGANSIWQILEFLPARSREWLQSILMSVPIHGWDILFKFLFIVLPHRYQLKNPGEKLHRLARRIASSDFKDFYSKVIRHWPPDVVAKGGEFTALRLPETLSSLDHLSYMALYDIFTYLPDDILVKLDRASMAHSLEAREPLLDYRVVEYALSLPTSIKFRGGTPKWILKKILESHLPRKLFERPKTGFGVPIDSWLRNELKEWASDLLNPSTLAVQGLFNPKIVSRYLAEHLAGQANHMYLLWDILMFQAWARENNY